MEPERYAQRSGAGTAARTNDFGQPIGIEFTGWKSPAAPYMPYGPFTAYADFSRLSTITAPHSTDIVAVVGS